MPNRSAAAGASRAHGLLIAGPGCEHDGRFDDGRVALGTYGALESRESLDGHRRSTDEQGSVACAVGQLVQQAGPAAGEMNLDRVRQPRARRECIVPVSHDDRGASVVDVELRLGDRLVVA